MLGKKTNKLLKLFKLINKCNIFNKYITYILPITGIIILIIIFITSFFYNFDTLLNDKNNSTDNINDLINYTQLHSEILNCSFNNIYQINCLEIIIGIIIILFQSIILIVIGILFKKYLN